MLPVVDISPLAGNDPAARRAVAMHIGETCERLGFLHVAGHGVPDEVIARAKQAMTAFFALPEATKRRHTRKPGVLRGYIPPMPFGRNVPGAPATTYEGFNFGVEVAPGDPETAASQGLYAPNVWPGEPAGFRAAMTDYWDGADRIARRLHDAFALALGQPEDSLRRPFDHPLTNVSLLRYHARPDAMDAPPDDTVGHRDTNALTVLLPDPVGGLQVRDPDGIYREVPAVPGCFVVNVGNMMTCWSGGRFRSTMHRVHPPRQQDRFSIAFFAVPAYDTLVAPLPGLPEIGAPEDMAPRHAGRDLMGFVENFDRLVRAMDSP